MKQTFLSSISVLVAFFLIFFLYTKVAGPIPFAVTSVMTTKTDTFTVTGTGKATVEPDIAYVTAGVKVTGSTVKQTQTDMNTKINAVSEAIKTLGIDEKDIQTTRYSVNPTYDYSRETQRITGYQANTSMQIKIRDLEKVNTVIDAATKAGANSIGNISFDVDDRTKAENEARKQASDEAKKKAENAASIAGFKLGRIVNYQESSDSNVRPIMYAAAGGEKSLASPQADTAIEPGSSDIEITVTLSYEIQ